MGKSILTLASRSRPADRAERVVRRGHGAGPDLRQTVVCGPEHARFILKP